LQIVGHQRLTFGGPLSTGLCDNSVSLKKLFLSGNYKHHHAPLGISLVSSCDKVRSLTYLLNNKYESQYVV